VTANEVTTTSGYLENLPLKVISGSAKIVYDTLNGENCKIIECVSDCILKLEGLYTTYGFNGFVNDTAFVGQLMADGDMEKAGVTDWIAGNSCILTKEASVLNGGSQCIKIYRAGSFGTAYQNILTTGVTYRVRGYVRSDGISTGSVFIGTTNVFVSTTSTEWQYFDVSLVSNNVFLQLKKESTLDSYVEFNDILVQSLNDIKLSTGDELIWSSQKGTYDLYKEN